MTPSRDSEIVGSDMAERENSNLLTTRTKVSVVADAQSTSLPLCGSCNGAFDRGFVSGLDNHKIEPEQLRRCRSKRMLSCMRPGLFGLTRSAIRVTPGRSSCNSSIRLATSSTPIKVAPVTSLLDGGDFVRSRREPDRRRS